MSLEFAGQVAVVLGAASGIGRATAEAFRKSGASVAWLDCVPEVSDIAQQHEASLGGTGESLSFVVDATHYPTLQAISRELAERWGRVDQMVVSIGMSSGAYGFPFWKLDPGLWQRVVDVNLIGPVNAAHAFVDLLLHGHEGSLCFVTSVAGQMGSQTDPPYSAAKAGLINFAQCAAKDFAPYGVRVNCVSPGMVKTPLNSKVWEAWRERSADHQLSYEDWAAQKIKQVAPLGRWQSCDDIAEAILFLASSRARNITGQTINVDGGQVMHS